ncbi:MAG: alpha/beta hydrolase [Alphaproteobacteria bacterium]|nr:alpha/beta hydrolase [Alphaproteobacteria bacterium]
MPLDRHAKRFLEMLAAAGQSRGRYQDAQERRQALTSLAELVDPPDTMPIGGVRDHLLAVSDGHITLRVYSPLEAPARVLPGMLFFHGGGWVAGSLDTHDGLCRRLANETGCRVIAVDYRLAPEHPFPFGLADACSALSHVAGHARDFGIDPSRLGVAGDSAGGTLAAALCRIARDSRRQGRAAPAIAFQLLLCPILDVHGEAASRRDLSEGYFLDGETLNRDLELYVPAGTDFSDPRLSPLCAEEFADLPPAFIHTGQFDPFGDEGEAYAQRLGGFGVPVHGRTHPGMIHYFYCMPRMIPYAGEAMRIIGAEIRYAVQLPPPERRGQRRIRPVLIRA